MFSFAIRRLRVKRRFVLSLLGFGSLIYCLQFIAPSRNRNPPFLKDAAQHINEPSLDSLPGGYHAPSTRDNLPNDNSAHSRKSIGPCGIESQCADDELAFNVSTCTVTKPAACLNNLMIFDSDKARSIGISIVVLDEKKHSVQDIKYFDLSENDEAFMSYVTSDIEDFRLVLFAAYGKTDDKITDGIIDVLHHFGIDTDRLALANNSSFVALGQKGLKTGRGRFRAIYPPLVTKSPSRKDECVSLSGCISIPMGPLEHIKFLGPSGGKSHDHGVLNPGKDDFLGLQVGQVVRDVEYGDSLPHCGMKSPCKATEMSAYLYSGKSKDDQPKMCLDDRFVIANNLNKGGRGLNVAVVNVTARQILRVGRFDTYGEDSSALEIFMEDTIYGETVIIVSFDEASTRLSNMAKQMFFELGSGLVQNIKFRAAWYFIGQKGIKGFSPFEELHYASGNDWAEPIDKKLCLPRFLDGLKVRPDPIVKTKNQAKRVFCSRYDGYEEFCEDTYIDDSLTPAPLHDTALKGNPIFNVPILVIAGLSHNSLRLCLETVIRQPGIVPQNVLVAFDENFPEVEALAHLFGTKTFKLSSSSSQPEQVAKALEAVWVSFPEAEYAIILEEDLLLSSDFLHFMAQLLPVLKEDDTLSAVSAWNDNGFQRASGLSTDVYRVEGFPGFGFMLPLRTYNASMRGHMKQCCNVRMWEGWNIYQVNEENELDKQSAQNNSSNPVSSDGLSKESAGSKLVKPKATPTSAKPIHIVIPDVSRVYRHHSEGLGIIPPHIEDLFHRKRGYNSDPLTKLAAPSSVKQSEYDAVIRSYVSLTVGGSLFKHSVFESCFSWVPPTPDPRKAKDKFIVTHQDPNELPPLINLPKTTGIVADTFVTFFEQRTPTDQRILYRLAQCFGLYHSPGRPARGLYKNVLRFSYDSHPVILVGSQSPFFSLKPLDYHPLSIADLSGTHKHSSDLGPRSGSVRQSAGTKDIPESKLLQNPSVDSPAAPILEHHAPPKVPNVS